MLKPLHPGLQPLGIFDIEDDDTDVMKGGEVGIFEALNTTSDAYAADVFEYGLASVHVSLDKVTAVGNLYGLVDEGIAGYGTLFGSVIGMATGKGTGFGAQSTQGMVVIGPTTTAGSGKVTLWSKPGLYGVTSDAWVSAAQFNLGTINVALYGVAADGTNDGKLTTSSSSNGVAVAVAVGTVTDTSLVSTTTTAAGSTVSANEYKSVYLTGIQF